MIKILQQKIVVARKEYKCIDCNKIINKGDKYLSQIQQPEFTNPQFFKICMSCQTVEVKN